MAYNYNPYNNNQQYQPGYGAQPTILPGSAGVPTQTLVYREGVQGQYPSQPYPPQQYEQQQHGGHNESHHHHHHHEHHQPPPHEHHEHHEHHHHHHHHH